ncbi:hypothetical protein [Aneurinibacillus migulanus]|uniref:hypothetical protein n=1 Tax=Aneurinibacillus migulanus TaxID=47500 RepID=UPI001F1575AB|nr:hypothetical protein [Aneurinibacillus migulanus]
MKNMRGVCQTLLFPYGACGMAGEKDRQLSPSPEMPRCFVGPLEVTQSGRLASLWKKDERQHPRVFLIFFILALIGYV